MRSDCDCGGQRHLTLDMFRWKGRSFSGYLCSDCKGLWENPEDSMFEYIKEVEG